MDQCSNFLGKAYKVASWVLQKIPLRSDNVKSDLQTICKLGGKVMSKVPEIAIGNIEHAYLYLIILSRTGVCSDRQFIHHRKG